MDQYILFRFTHNCQNYFVKVKGNLNDPYRVAYVKITKRLLKLYGHYNITDVWVKRENIGWSRYYEKN